MSFLQNAGMKCTLFTGVQRLQYFKSLRCMSTHECVSKKGKDESGVPVHSTYQISEVEANSYELWESRNYFKPSKSVKDSFVVLLPPPNITGTLHLGHALTCIVQDVIVRWKRMKGESVLWVPGVDHAGIATQVAVEKFIAQRSGLSRHELGREKFVNAIWEWKDEKVPKIIQQLKRLGASLDWSKLIFTLDPSHSDLVKKSFIQLYNEGLIYRKKGLVNWSCALKSTISDIEVDTITIEKKTDIVIPGYDKAVGFGYLYEFAYKVCDEDDEIVVSTTRPETMLGDVAVAIHPDSPAHSKYKNKFVWHPFRNEKIPIIEDDFVDPNFGSGAVKITPAHSLIDFEVGQRHKLKCIPVINEEGFINNVVETFHGLKRFDARWAVIKELKNLNLFRGSKSHSMKLPICSRSGDVVELIEKEQWFLKCDPLVTKALDAVNSGHLEIKPEFHKYVWNDWLSKKPVIDWNLSRQLWWGHQVPMYECRHKEKIIWVPGLSLEEAKSKASAELGVPPDDISVTQDPDVLDTWFSSGLLSLNEVIDQKKSPPISLMVTGHDILFFWLARMVMLSLHLKGELPFKEIFLHGLVCNANGKKMSKSMGNVIHPDDVINGLSKSEMEARLRNDLQEGRITKENFRKALDSQNAEFPKGIPPCGTDALRLTFCLAKVNGVFTNFRMDNCVSNKVFCNKIYQGFNYFNKISGAYKEKRREFDVEDVKALKEKLNYFDFWILSRLASVIACVEKNMHLYKFDTAAKEIKDFVVDDFCNFYLFHLVCLPGHHPFANVTNASLCVPAGSNTTKSILEDCSSSQFKTTFSVFFHGFETFLRLLSPFMPYLTEYLYQAMPSLNGYNKYESVTVAKYPNPADWTEFQDVDLELRFRKLSEFLTTLRRTNILLNLMNEKPNVMIKCPDDLAEVLFSDMQYVFTTLGGARHLSRVDSVDRKNVVPQEIDQHFVLFIEHNYDRATMLKLIQSTVGKEKELQRDLNKLLQVANGPELKKMSESEKFRLTKEINDLNLDLRRIEGFKFAADNCDR